MVHSYHMQQRLSYKSHTCLTKYEGNITILKPNDELQQLRIDKCEISHTFDFTNVEFHTLRFAKCEISHTSIR